MAKAMHAIAIDHSGGTLIALLGFAMLYGILHAAGPGHRKTVVFSLFIGRKAALWEPLAVGFLAAAVHAGAGMVLVGALSLVYGAVAGLGDTEFAAAYIDAATFGLLIVLALILVAMKIKALLGGAGHTHPAGKGRTLYGIVFVSSLVPCPGATMILLFALYANVPWLGIIAVIAMSIGMGIVISASAYLAYVGRKQMFGYLKTKERLIGLVSDGLELVSYLLLLGFSLYMAWPMLAGVIA
jgi:ABC-type nickel/cobalt efflux system permease component RcnA